MIMMIALTLETHSLSVENSDKKSMNLRFSFGKIMAYYPAVGSFIPGTFTTFQKLLIRTFSTLISFFPDRVSGI